MAATHSSADHKTPDVAPFLLHVLLNIEDGMMVASECRLVLKQGLGGIPVVDLGKQSPPGADGGLQHNRIPHLLDRRERRFFGEGDPYLRLRDVVLGQDDGRQKFVAAGPCRMRRIDAADPLTFKDPQGMQCARMIDASFHDRVEGPFRFAQPEPELTVIHRHNLDIRPGLECIQKEFFVLAQDRMKKPYPGHTGSSAAARTLGWRRELRSRESSWRSTVLPV